MDSTHQLALRSNSKVAIGDDSSSVRSNTDSLASVAWKTQKKWPKNLIRHVSRLKKKIRQEVVQQIRSDLIREGFKNITVKPIVVEK